MLEPMHDKSITQINVNGMKAGTNSLTLFRNGKMRELASCQIKGIQAGLTRDQVAGLGYYQIKGMLAGLSREQVKYHNYGRHTLVGIRTLRGHDANLLLVDAYKQVQGLDYDQVEGVLSGLRHDQVAGLGYYQIKGMLAGLSREQVQSNNFLSLLKDITHLLIIRSTNIIVAIGKNLFQGMYSLFSGIIPKFTSSRNSSAIGSRTLQTLNSENKISRTAATNADNDPQTVNPSIPGS